MAALTAALCVNLNAPFYGSMEVQAAAQRLPARNHLRYGFSQTRGLANFSPSGQDREEFGRHWWINHPPLSTIYTAAVYAVLGDSVAVTRLTGILFAAFALPLVWLAARRLHSPAAGAWAALLYATAGVTLWDARRPEYFQPSLFLILLSFVVFLSWRERPSIGRWTGVVLPILVSSQIDWMGCLFGAALGIYAVIAQRRRGLLPAAILVGALAGSFLFFVLYVRWVVGPESSRYLWELLGRRAGGSSRPAALLTQAVSVVTHVGGIAALAAGAGLAFPRLLTPGSRGPVWFLFAYGVAASQVLVAWTLYHAYVAAWFVLPFLVIGGGIALARASALPRSESVRRAFVAAVMSLALGQGLATAVYRHRQDTWYRPDRQLIGVLRAHVPPSSWVATPLRHMNEPIIIDETDCNPFWDVAGRSRVEALLLRTPCLHLLWPKPESDEGFWADLSGPSREKYGVRPLDPDLQPLLTEAERRDLGAYDLFILRRPR